MNFAVTPRSAKHRRCTHDPVVCENARMSTTAPAALTFLQTAPFRRFRAKVLGKVHNCDIRREEPQTCRCPVSVGRNACHVQLLGMQPFTSVPFLQIPCQTPIIPAHGTTVGASIAMQAGE